MIAQPQTRPVGWRYQSERHSLAARGYRTKQGVVPGCIRDSAGMQLFLARKSVVGKAKEGPFTGNIQDLSLKNKNFRRVLYTGKHEQLVEMSIPPGGDIGNEVHHHTDQFIRVEGGKAEFIFENGKKKYETGDGGSVIVPAGTWHNVVNKSKVPLKVYTVYAPPHHPVGMVDKTKQAAILREQHHGQ